MLSEQVSEVGVEACLIIDDAHVARAAACRELFDQLIHGGPRTLHVILATRERSGIPVSALRLQDEIHEITADDLKFDDGDIRALFGQSIDERASRQLIERTEGWPVAVQLAQLTHDGNVPLIRHIGRLSGSQAQVADYLSERVFRGLPERLRQFLLETAHLERLNGDLADAVRERSDGWGNLHAVWTSGALMSRLEAPEEGWFEIHQLFLEYLRHRQVFLGRERIAALNRRAADWFFRAGDLRSAIHHAKAGSDYGRAIAYIEDAGGVRVGIREGVGYLRSLLEQIPSRLIHASPRVKLCAAYVLAKEGRLAEAGRNLDEVAAEGVADDGALADEIILIGSLFRIYEDRTISSEDIARLENVTEATPESEPLVRGVLHNLLCIAQMQAGDLVNARLSGERAMAYYEDLDALYLQFFIHVNMSIVDFEQGLLGDARKRREAALDLVERHFPADKGLAGIASVLLAEVRLERGEPLSACRHVFESLRDIEVREGWSEVYMPGYAVAMEVAFADDGLDGALGVLDQAERTARRRNASRLQRLTRYRRLDLLVRANRRDLADPALRDIERGPDGDSDGGGPCWRGGYMAAFCLARYQMRFGDGARALELLEDAVGRADRTGAIRFLVKGLVLQSMALHETGDTRSAAGAFKRAAGLGSSLGFHACLVEEGEPLATCVRAIVRATGIGDMDPAAVEFVARLLSDLCAKDPGESPPILTLREQEVMERLAFGNSSKRIARYLGLSEPTVKFHLKNIYAKLGVNKRALAVSVASRYGLCNVPESSSPLRNGSA